MYSKRFKKIVAIVMIVIMVMANVNLDFSSLFQNNKKTDVEVQAKETKEKEPTVVKELEYLRTADSSTYLLSNGSKRLELYGEDIRYEKNGKFIDYDPTLKKIVSNKKKELKSSIKSSEILNENTVEDYAYTNTSSDSSLYFPKKFDENTGIFLEKEDKIINFKPIYEELEDSAVNEVETETLQTETVETRENTEVAVKSVQEQEDTELQTSSIEIKENGVKNNIITILMKLITLSINILHYQQV